MTTNPRQVIDRQHRITRVSIEPGAYGGAAQINFAYQVVKTLDSFPILTSRGSKCAKLLTQSHWHSILQLSTTHFDD